MVHSGLEDLAPRSWNFQGDLLKFTANIDFYMPPDGIVAAEEKCGIYPPFGSYKPRDTLSYIYAKNGRDAPDHLYDASHKPTKSFPKITSNFKSTVARFKDFTTWTPAPCDNSNMRVWLSAKRKVLLHKPRNKTVAKLVEYQNNEAIMKTRLFDGPRVSCRGRANGYTIDAHGNIFEKNGDTTLCEKNKFGCSAPVEFIRQRFCNSTFSKMSRRSLFAFTIGPTPAIGSDTSAVVFEKNMVIYHPGVTQAVIRGCFPEARDGQVFQKQKQRDQAWAMGTNTRTTSTYTNPQTTIKACKVTCNIGFLSKVPRFITKHGGKSTYPMVDLVPFINLRDLIHGAQANKNLHYFGSSTPRDFAFAREKCGPGQNKYSLPSTIKVSVRNEHQNDSNKENQFPWQGWQKNESCFKKKLDRIPPPGWYEVAKSFHASMDKRSYHKPYLAKNIPGFDSSDQRKSAVALSAARPTPGVNVYNCERWERLRRNRTFGLKFSQAKQRTFFDMQPNGIPGPDHYKIATIISSSIAKKTFNVKYPNPFRQPWRQIHPPKYEHRARLAFMTYRSPVC